MEHRGYVFNIGFNKCGTTSLSDALNLLGIRTVHHRVTIGNAVPPRTVRLVDIWRHNLARQRRPFHGLDHALRGFSDFNGEACFKLLDQIYPGSKFILTIRPVEDWLRSREAHVQRNLARPGYRGGFKTVDRPGWRRLFETHLDEVRQHFAHRPKDLLVLDIPSGDRWAPLCTFLGVDAPSQAFPWGNRSTEPGASVDPVPIDTNATVPSPDAPQTASNPR